MNHDYAHCLDYQSDCPEECFRAQLARDLIEHNLYGIPLLFTHFKNTDECERGKDEDKSVEKRTG